MSWVYLLLDDNKYYCIYVCTKERERETEREREREINYSRISFLVEFVKKDLEGLPSLYNGLWWLNNLASNQILSISWFFLKSSLLTTCLKHLTVSMTKTKSWESEVGASCGVMVCKLDCQNFISDFESHWVPHPYGLVPLYKKAL